MVNHLLCIVLQSWIVTDQLLRWSKIKITPNTIPTVCSSMNPIFKTTSAFRLLQPRLSEIHCRSRTLNRWISTCNLSLWYLVKEELHSRVSIECIWDIKEISKISLMSCNFVWHDVGNAANLFGGRMACFGHLLPFLVLDWNENRIWGNFNHPLSRASG